MAISRKGMRRITVDGEEYYWSALGDIDSRVAIVTADGLERGQHGRWIRFGMLFEPDLTQPGWWEDLRVTVTPKMIQRAIARRRGFTADIELTTGEMREVIGREMLRFEDELQALARDLETNAVTGLVARLLAVGCREGPASLPLVDDWTACHSETLALWRLWMQHLLDTARYSARQELAMRSAVEFFVTMCKRVGIEVVLDMRKFDERLRLIRWVTVLPWGIPDSHWWWTGV
jgi:hypothetical protein